jgi:integrase
MGINGLTKPERPLFPLAAKDWLGAKSALSPLGLRYYRQYVAKLSRQFSNRLITDITAEDVANLQRQRLGEGLSGPQINAEVGTLRAILRHYGRWAYISGRVRMLPQRSDVGRALSRAEELRLLQAIGESRSAALYPFFMLSLDSGLRPSEIRSLRRSNLRLNWRDGTIIHGEVIVGRSKTAAGTGRIVPLTRRVCAALTLWLSRFAEARPDAYVFPFHRVAIAGNGRVPHIYDVNLDTPMSPSSYQTAFETARKKSLESSFASTMRATVS